MSLPTADELRALVARMEGDRPILAVPYSYELDGEVWTIACDGHGLLAVRRDDGFMRADLVPLAPKFAGAEGHGDYRDIEADASMTLARGAPERDLTP